MDYFTLTISGVSNLDADFAESISLIAWQAGCAGIEEPQEQPGAKPRPAAAVWRIFFAEPAAAGQCRDDLAAMFREAGAAGVQLEIESRAPENWMAGWRDYFHPVRVGEGFIVAPPWWDAEADNNGGLATGRKVIRIEPGMAFGTGTHATTQLCLELAEPHLRPGLCVLDVGTGSGILLIAAALRGASPAVGVDIDAETIENFCLNVELNGLKQLSAISRQPSAASGGPSAISPQPSVSVKSEIPNPKPEIEFILSDGLNGINHLGFDLVFANLLAPHIDALLAQMREPRFAAEAARPLLIGSGLLAEEWPALRRGWEERFGLAVEREAFRGEWMAFAGRLKS